MTTIKAFRLASVVTAIDVLVASGFSIVGVIRPQYLLPAGSVPTHASLMLAIYAAARTIPLALFALGTIYKQATQALLFLGALAGTLQLLDAGIGLFDRDPGKCVGPLFIAVLQFFVVYLLHKSLRTSSEMPRGNRVLRPGSMLPRTDKMPGGDSGQSGNGHEPTDRDNAARSGWNWFAG